MSRHTSRGRGRLPPKLDIDGILRDQQRRNLPDSVVTDREQENLARQKKSVRVFERREADDKTANFYLFEPRTLFERLSNSCSKNANYVRLFWKATARRTAVSPFFYTGKIDGLFE